ncbi:MAG: RluA family pseudouridine synthase [Myxococcales bacterium]|nr:RluA family pseudouridine synthase [Myxococcales bacterium]
MLLTVADEAAGSRLDRFLADQLPDHSRTRLAAWIRDGYVRLDGAPARPSVKLAAGQQVHVDPPADPAPVLEAQPIPLTIVYSDAHLVVVDKPAGLVVHPGAGNPDGTVVHGLLHHFGALSPVGAPERPGVVHRIDAGTSGLIVFARTEAAHHHLAAQFAAHSVDRVYLALAWDHGLAETGTHATRYGRHPVDRRKFTTTVDGGKHAVTHWRVIERLPPCAWVELRLETGRTHQIRVHFAEAGHPLVGDETYGRHRRVDRPAALRTLGVELGLTRQALHAARLGFRHPAREETLCFESPVPPDIAAVREALRAGGAR